MSRVQVPRTPRTSPKDFPRYAFWNNKGGVGKTFMTFVVAAEYARVHPEQTIVVIDMCPQANVSEIMLGGNGIGASRLTQLMQKTPRQTIGGYFDQRLSAPHAKTGTEFSFLVDAHAINNRLPTNMKMVAGDPSLEVQTQAINQIAALTLPQSAWANVHRWLLDLVEAIRTQLPDTVFFIDCNPSFSAYTELALLAANRLIVPCTADGSSARAIDNVGQLLYGINLPQAYTAASFYAKANQFGLSLPSIYLVPLNRSTQFDKKASKAFGAMYEEIQGRVDELRQQMPTAFSMPQSMSSFFDMPDAHSVSVVVSHLGLPIADVTSGSHTIHNIMAQVNPEPLDRYKTAVSNLVALL